MQRIEESEILHNGGTVWKNKGVRGREWWTRTDWFCWHMQGADFFCANEDLLICCTLTFQHFTPHKAPECTKLHANGELRVILELLLVRPPRHVNLLGLQGVVHGKGNGCDTQFCIDPCVEGLAFLSLHTEFRVSCRTHLPEQTGIQFLAQGHLQAEDICLLIQ